jgi:hypothetical protein
LDPSIALMASCAGKWTEDEDLKLKHSVQTHGGKNWVAIAALVPGRKQKQCHIDTGINWTCRRQSRHRVKTPVLQGNRQLSRHDVLMVFVFACEARFYNRLLLLRAEI